MCPSLPHAHKEADSVHKQLQSLVVTASPLGDRFFVLEPGSYTKEAELKPSECESLPSDKSSSVSNFCS